MPNVKKALMNSGKWMQFVDQLLFAIGLINPSYNFMSPSNNKNMSHRNKNSAPVKTPMIR